MARQTHSERGIGRVRRRQGLCWLLEVMERRRLLSVYTVTSTLDGAGLAGTLRWAIQQVNNDRTPDSIQFQLGSGVQTIELQSPLPALTNSVTIEGPTSPGPRPSPQVVIDGSGLPAGANGLVIEASSSVIENLSLVGFPGAGLVLSGADGDVVAGNELGILPTGAAKGNGTGLLLLSSSSNTIGGATTGAANVLSGNLGFGLSIQNESTNSTDNVIEGNLIGVDPSGLLPVANDLGGVLISGATGNALGGGGQGMFNVISGNQGPGITLEDGAADTLIQGNSIGLGIDGRTAVGNTGDGILVSGSEDVQIGGTELGQGNLISGNQGSGVEVQGASEGLALLGNFIGTDSTGLRQLGNRLNGITLGSSGVSVGGTVAGAGNTIEFNGSGGSGAGVQLVGEVNHDTILSNSIYQNAGLGINLGSGPTSNHPPGTPGPNDYQNYPVLTQAQSDGKATQVTGSLSALPSTLYIIQFFASPTPDPTGFGQGLNLIGQIEVTTDAAGNASFNVPVSGTAPGTTLSATATSPLGDTSEFSMDVTTQGVIDLRASATVSPNPVPSGSAATFTITVQNQGSIDAHQVVLTNTPPAGQTITSVSTSQGYVLPGPSATLVAQFGTIPAGGSAVLTITVQTAAGFSGTITDSASAASQETDPFPQLESASVSALVETSTDLVSTLSAAPNPAPFQGDVALSINVADNGKNPAPDTAVSLPLPAGLTFVSATSSEGSVSFSAGVLTAALGDLAAGASAVVTVQIQAAQLGAFALTASASSNNLNTDPNQGQSTTTLNVVPAAQLVTTVSTAASKVLSGSTLAYQISVANQGPDAADDVIVTDALPAGVEFLSASTDQKAAPSESGGVVTLDLASLGAGDTATLTIEVQAVAPPGTAISNTASASSQTLDPDPSLASAAANILVVGSSDLALSATAPVSAYASEPITYTLTASNLGTANEPDAVVSAQLPPGLVLIAGSSSQGHAPVVNAQGDLTAALGELDAGSTATMTLVLQPGATDVGDMGVDFTIAGQNLDPNPANNTALTSVAVSAASALAVSLKPVGQAYDQVGFTYTVTITNNGPCPAPDVTLSAPLPGNGSLLSDSMSQGPPPSVDAGIVSDALGTLPVGGSATLSIVVRPQGTSPLALSASATSGDINPNPAAAQVQTTQTVDPSVDLKVSLSANLTAQLTGKPIFFTAMVANQGPDPASDVVLTIPYGSTLQYNGSSTSVGSASAQQGQFQALLGPLAPGAQATTVLVVTPMDPGPINLTAVASSSEYQSVPADAAAQASSTAIESPGTLVFSAPLYTVTELAGAATITVYRAFGSQGAVSVPYSTSPLNATPGLDYIPVSGTLSFAPGQTSATFTVPVLPNPWDNHNEWLSLSLGTPTGGAWLGPTSTAQLQIIDLDPNHTPPQVASLTWTGNAAAITSLDVAFTAPLDPAFASNPADYVLTNSWGSAIPVSVSYNPADRSTILVPITPLPSGQVFDLRVVGTGPSALRDIAGNVLAGAGPGASGTDYLAVFEQARRLQYIDDAHNRVTIAVKGPGYLDQVRSITGASQAITLIGMVPRKTKLVGNVHRLAGGTGRTNVGVINGLGSFGQVDVALQSPPFFARQFPFFRHGRGVL